MSRVLCFRGAVNTWECDEMGHMNVRFYKAKAYQGLSLLCAELGLSPQWLADRGLAVRAKEQHIRFLRELHAGADLSIEGGVVDSSENEILFFQEILPLTASHVSATLLTKIHLVDITSGKEVLLPEACQDAARNMRTEVPGYGQPRSLDLSHVIESIDADGAIGRGHLNVSTQMIRSNQVDQNGLLYPDEFIGFVSDGIGNLFGLITKDDVDIYERTEEVGGAALEYRFEYHRFPRVGDHIQILSAPAEILGKAYKLRHVIVDPITYDVLVRAESVHIAFDLAQRKAIEIPDRLRAGLKKFLAP
jgi:acyl-CoA thioester hydrolase